MKNRFDYQDKYYKAYPNADRNQHCNHDSNQPSNDEIRTLIQITTKTKSTAIQIWGQIT